MGRKGRTRQSAKWVQAGRGCNMARLPQRRDLQEIVARRHNLMHPITQLVKHIVSQLLDQVFIRILRMAICGKSEHKHQNNVACHFGSPEEKRIVSAQSNERSQSFQFYPRIIIFSTFQRCLVLLEYVCMPLMRSDASGCVWTFSGVSKIRKSTSK